MANAFNNFFMTLTEHTNIQPKGKGDAISVLKDSFPGNFPSVKIIPVTEAEKKCIIHFLLNIYIYVSGYDEIPTEI